MKKSALTWNDKFELFDGIYSVSDFQDYFEYTTKKYQTLLDYTTTSLTDNPPIQIL